MSVVVVDWLGRGGIAQCTTSWVRVLAEHGDVPWVVTIADRELHADQLGDTRVLGVTAGRDRISRHRHLALDAARLIRAERPETVIVQNYIVPLLERPVVDAARQVGARLVWVVHNHRSHSLLGGTSLGLRRNLDAADQIVAHSAFVAERIASSTPVRVIPLPVPSAYDPGPADRPVLVAPDGAQMALHFGILKRGYKGTDTVVELAGLLAATHRAPGPWVIGAVGVGAPPPGPGLVSSDGFAPAGRLAATVASAAATLLPYQHATQSAAVAMSQHLGTVPVASAVGGIVEQIEHGRTGLLVRPGATAQEWLDALTAIEDEPTRAQMADACRAESVRRAQRFDAEVRSLTAR